MKKIKHAIQAAIGLFLLIVFLIFSFNNLDTTEIEFLKFNVTVPLFIVLIGTLCLGIFLGYFIGLFHSWKSSTTQDKKQETTI